MGRHNNIDSFYLCQTYSHIPKQLLRDNANMIMLFKQDELNLKHVFSDHVTPDMKIAQEEIFGPVIAITKFKDEADAIRIGNNTEYGMYPCPFWKCE